MKPKDKPLTCQRCHLDIYGPELRHVVRLSGGVMHGTCHTRHAEAVSAMIEAAIAAGTHGVQNQDHPTVAEIRARIETEQLERPERIRASRMKNQTHQPTGAMP